MKPKKILIPEYIGGLPACVVLVYGESDEVPKISASLDICVLDRDGTLNRDEGYVHGESNLEIPGDVYESVPVLDENSSVTVIGSNQSGVGMGEFTVEDSIEFTNALIEEIYRETEVLVYAAALCFYRPGGKVEPLARDSDWRKPNPGMLDFLARYYGAGTGVMVGDSNDDLGAAESVGWPGYKIDADRERTSMVDVLEDLEQDIEGFGCRH